MLTASSDHLKKAEKLHRQFGHPSADRLIRMMRNADIKDLELERKIRNITETCDVCVKHKRPSPRPVVSVPMAEKFNDVVAMDLKKWQQYTF